MHAQALQIVSTDISTACHLGVCIAVRITEAVPLINTLPDVGGVKFSIPALETALRLSGLGKQSKQRFLKSSSKDDSIKPSRKGAGGNTAETPGEEANSEGTQGDPIDQQRISDSESETDAFLYIDSNGTIHATLHINNINFINIYYLILASTVKKLKLSSP